MKKAIASLLFSIAFGLVECGVVIYAREAYYPEGSLFPLKRVEPNIAIMEIFREISTIVLIALFSIYIGKNFMEKLGYFIYIFGTWDIFYYFFLFFFYGQPNSLLEWDLLFLIPVPWAGHVYQPILCAIAMIVLGTGIIKIGKNFSLLSIMCLTLGSICTIISWTLEFFIFINKKIGNLSFWSIFLDPQKMVDFAEGFQPTTQYHFLFFIGLFFIYLGVIAYYWKWIDLRQKK